MTQTPPKNIIYFQGGQKWLQHVFYVTFAKVESKSQIDLVSLTAVDIC